MKFYKFPEILAENSVIPGNSHREFLVWQIPGISVALIKIQLFSAILRQQKIQFKKRKAVYSC